MLDVPTPKRGPDNGIALDEGERLETSPQRARASVNVDGK